MQIITDSQSLTIQFEGLEQFWAFRRKLVVPKTSIVSIKWYEAFASEQRLLRVAGTGIPHTLSAGRFMGSGQRAFLYIRGARGLRRAANHVMEIKTTNFA